MAKRKILTGNFGRLTVIKRVDDIVSQNGNKAAAYLCECECGNTTTVRGSELVSGSTRSCGCLRKEMMSKKQFKHGGRHKRIYSIYCDMKKRCYNSKYKEYYLYGGRGIKICDEWLGEHGFTNFYNWSILNGYADNLSIDRIDMNKNYEPENCRWTDAYVQSNNRRICIRVFYNGKYITIAEMAKLTGYTYGGVYDMVKRGTIEFVRLDDLEKS